jgi:polysaccharide biosynthesis/export protein
MVKRALYILVLACSLLGSLPQAQAADSQSYTLGPEDSIEIAVENHPEFSGTFTINADGKFQYKSLGHYEAAGLTRPQLEERVKSIVSQYVVAPEVSVQISDYKSKAFYVLGEVSRPGKYYMNTPAITAKEAIVMAGLPISSAALNKVKIITPGANGSTIKEIDVQALLYAGDMKQNVMIHPGDSIFFPADVKAPVEEKKEATLNKEKMRDIVVNSAESLRYTLGPDDVLEINVLDQPDFSGTYTVSSEGKLQYKYFGDIDVTGMTKNQLEEKLKSLMSSYTSSPQVNVTVKEFKSKVFYVLGEVRRPGKYYMRSEAISLKDAVVMAGLPTATAALRKVKITTPSGVSKEVDLHAVLYGGSLRDNLMLSPGDSIYIPGAMTESARRTSGEINKFDPLKYTLGPDDEIDIQVMNQPGFSGVYLVSLEGKIQYKFVGDIYVSGMTKAQLEDKIKGIISPYVSNPQVNVMITEFRSKAFYVVGEVGAPGKYFMRADSIPVNEAVVMAGLPTVSAAMRKTQIISPAVRGPKVRKVNLYTLLYGGDLRENLVLNPGDYLYVPSTVLAKVIRIMSPVSSTIGLAVGPAASVGDSRAGIQTLSGR